MSPPLVRGWCPGAYRPMRSGDGLVVRVRPCCARLTRAQILGLCAAATRHGNGMIDLTNRANLQLRGVTDQSHAPLLDELSALGLLDDRPEIEARRNILVTPFYRPGDLTTRLNRALIARLDALPGLPAKFGMVVDTGAARVLAHESGDIRLERDLAGGLVVRADGAGTGRLTSETEAIDQVIALAGWFALNASGETRRMARLLRSRAVPAIWRGAAPAAPGAVAEPGAIADPALCGRAYGVPFGQLEAQALAGLIETAGARALRVTPWRVILLEGARDVPAPGFITGGDDPLRHADACSGAPACPQSQVETRPLARRLATRVGGTLHVSGCAKGCARRQPAKITLVGRNGRFDLVKRGHAGDVPALCGLTPETLSTMKF